MFKIVEDSDSQYFVEPTSEYYEKYSDKFIKEVCPKYSYGQLNRICFCRIYYDSDLKVLHLTHFNNYVREYYIKNKIKYEDPVFRGLGVRLLKSILIDFINSGLPGNTKIMLDMVNTKNKKLVYFYKNLSFCLIDDDNFFSNIDSVLQKLENVELI
jgi:hypothetical protein